MVSQGFTQPDVEVGVEDREDGRHSRDEDVVHLEVVSVLISEAEEVEQHILEGLKQENGVDDL